MDMKTIIVDDEPLAAEYLELLCGNISGIDVVGIFTNAVEALAYLQKSTVDLVFMDIEMPGMTGLEAVKWIRGIRGGIAVVFVTGYEQYALEAFKAEAVAYLLKPCSADEVTRAVARAKLLAPAPKNRAEVFTFGDFCLFIDGVPHRFSNSKAQELLALVIDRHGVPVAMEQAVSLLWEGRPYDETVKQLYRKAVIYLNQLTRENSLDFFVSNRASCHVLPDRISCDYYRLLMGDTEAMRQYSGVYMEAYSWAESTVAQLDRLAGNI